MLVIRGYDNATEGPKTHNGHPDGNVGRNVVQRDVCEPATPPSPEANRIEVPRAPSWAYALQSLLWWFISERHCGTVREHLRCQGPGDGVFVLTIARGQYLRRCGLAEQEVDDVQEAFEVSILEVLTNRDEGRRDTSDDADSELNIKILEVTNRCRPGKPRGKLGILTASTPACLPL